jgi:hypothetical protein
MKPLVRRIQNIIDHLSILKGSDYFQCLQNSAPHFTSLVFPHARIDGQFTTQGFHDDAVSTPGPAHCCDIEIYVPYRENPFLTLSPLALSQMKSTQ